MNSSSSPLGFLRHSPQENEGPGEECRNPTSLTNGLFSVNPSSVWRRVRIMVHGVRSGCDAQQDGFVPSTPVAPSQGLALAPKENNHSCFSVRLMEQMSPPSHGPSLNAWCRVRRQWGSYQPAASIGEYESGVRSAVALCPL